MRLRAGNIVSRSGNIPSVISFVLVCCIQILAGRSSPFVQSRAIKLLHVEQWCISNRLFSLSKLLVLCKMLNLDKYERLIFPWQNPFSDLLILRNLRRLLHSHFFCFVLHSKFHSVAIWFLIFIKNFYYIYNYIK